MPDNSDRNKKAWVEASCKFIFTDAMKSAIATASGTLTPEQAQAIPEICTEISQLLLSKHILEAQTVLIFSTLLADVIAVMTREAVKDQIERHGKN
jgi:hypothetical protein